MPAVRRRVRLMPIGFEGLGRRRRMKGRGAFADFFTKTIPSLAGRAFEAVKSRPLTALSTVIPQFRPFAPVAGALGLGRRRRRRAPTKRMPARMAMMKRALGLGRRKRVGFGRRRMQGGQLLPLSMPQIPVRQVVRF